MSVSERGCLIWQECQRGGTTSNQSDPLFQTSKKWRLCRSFHFTSSHIAGILCCLICRLYRDAWTLLAAWKVRNNANKNTHNICHTMVRKMCQFVLFVLNGQKQVTSSDPSFGSTHFHRNSLCWREKQAVGQPAGIFACKQAKWVSQI